MFRRRKKTIPCPAGEWTQVLFHFGRGYRQEIDLCIEADEGAEVAGEYREIRQFWIFPEGPRTGPLEPEMAFTRQWINSIYRLSFQPETDCVVTIL